uniref:MYND-type domain-containing protein n=1 Tax=Hyaloperonospora arabidopsidis (strain Emoy2) TaxID=559515 RepID=M4BPT1_HYAAE
MSEEVLNCARFGDDEELKTILDSVDNDARDALLNFVQPETLNTPLHMACANGHVDCVRELLKHGARHLPNANGNLPLHWAVQNTHREIVKLLVDGVQDLDVLSRNNFGRGCVTEAFQCDDPEILTMLLEHGSATEERLAEGTGMGKDALKEEIEEEGEEIDSSATPKVLQETVLEFDFVPGLPTLRARELALEWSKDAFGSSAEEDITGVSIWSAALILSRWIIDHRNVFDGKQVCELGSGCGVSGLAVHKYTNASRVVLSDLFAHTIQNLEHNVELNKMDKNAEPDKDDKPETPVLDCCSRCGTVQRFTPDNPEGKLMTCGGCRCVAYCSRECQKKAWKKHKSECKAIRAQREQTETRKENKVNEKGIVQVEAIDWAQRETWPVHCDDDKFDVLFGSDLVYHQDIVPVLVDVVDGMLGTEGRFLHVASQARHSLVEFKEAMEARGFSCNVKEIPDEYKTNPLVGNDAATELFALHFNEMSDVYCIYTFTRTTHSQSN